MTIREADEFLKSLKLKGNRRLIAEELVKEISGRLGFLLNVGLEYLTLSRQGPTLSGGESQRIRLASQVGSELTGVLYILDEPSIGPSPAGQYQTAFHPVPSPGYRKHPDCHRARPGKPWKPPTGSLISGRAPVCWAGRSLPRAHRNNCKKNKASVTGGYLAGKESIPTPKIRKTPKQTGNRWITIQKAAANNLAGITVRIPTGLLVAVTGVSGAGKSTLVNQILFPALAKKLHDASLEVGKHEGIKGLKHLNKVININQKAIGRTPRSNPATYTKLFDLIRDFFSLLPESRARGYKKGRFSFNVKGGRCEACRGDGYIKVEMHFLADVFVPCETCKGKRFNPSTLEVNYKGHSISDILDLSVRQAMELFDNHPAIRRILDTLMDVGLGYIKLGQPATTLSGGEAQRIKLARELAKRDTGSTLYILDEPTTGLHFQDIRQLIGVLKRLVDSGNSVIVIEHNLDVIKTADWIIDMGPEGGSGGGHVVAQGSPGKGGKGSGQLYGAFFEKNPSSLKKTTNASSFLDR